tara:strand:- start:88248 stop:88421 length:174 start_codon:yes stop_codon:yes gene_type:complete
MIWLSVLKYSFVAQQFKEMKSFISSPDYFTLINISQFLLFPKCFLLCADLKLEIKIK